LLAQGWWFSLGTPASSTTKTGCHDIAEILLKVALKHQRSIKSISMYILADSFLNEDVEDNLFSTKPPEVPEEPVKPKKPVGGVSMFGGFDPTSALKKRQEKNVPQKGKINFVFKPIC
jgi:hypothetical protein